MNPQCSNSCLELHPQSAPSPHIEKSCPPLHRLPHGYHQEAPGVEPRTLQFFCNHSYVLSGDAQRACQPDGTWSGTQPECVKGRAARPLKSGCSQRDRKNKTKMQKPRQQPTTLQHSVDNNSRTLTDWPNIESLTPTQVD